jgi:hypothetical protein
LKKDTGISTCQLILQLILEGLKDKIVQVNKKAILVLEAFAECSQKAEKPFEGSLFD